MIYDISPPITENLKVWPGDTSPSREVLCDMKDGVNIVALNEAIERMLATANETLLPPDIRISKASDQPAAVDKKVSEVVSNVISSIAVVILVLLFMAGLRTSAVWVVGFTQSMSDENMALIAKETKLIAEAITDAA